MFHWAYDHQWWFVLGMESWYYLQEGCANGLDVALKRKAAQCHGIRGHDGLGHFHRKHGKRAGAGGRSLSIAQALVAIRQQAEDLFTSTLKNPYCQVGSPGKLATPDVPVCVDCMPVDIANIHEATVASAGAGPMYVHTSSCRSTSAKEPQNPQSRSHSYTGSAAGAGAGGSCVAAGRVAGTAAAFGRSVFDGQCRHTAHHAWPA